jgi:hypothetical protein
MEPTTAQLYSQLSELERAADAALKAHGIESREYADALVRLGRYEDSLTTMIYSDGSTSAEEHYVNSTRGR